MFQLMVSTNQSCTTVLDGRMEILRFCLKLSTHRLHLFGLHCYKVRFADKCTYRTCSAKIVQFRGNINQFAKTP